MVRDAPVKFTRESLTAISVRGVGADGIRINDQLYRQSVALTTDTIIDDWQGKPVRELSVNDLDELLQAEPELILIGSGQRQRFASRDLTFAFARRGIGLEVMDTAAAARTFNVLAGEGRRVAAVLYHDA